MPAARPTSRPPQACAALGLLLAALPAASAFAQPQESVVLTMPGMASAFVLSDQRFGVGGGTELFFDAYYPGPKRPTEARPAIVFVSGGENVRDWPWYESYGRLAAAMGWVGIVPDKRYPRGLDGTKAGYDDTVRFLEYLKANAGRLGVDPDHVCVWVFSAGGRMASIPLSGAGMQVKALVAYYAVLDAANQVPEETPDRDAVLRRYSPLHAVRAGAGAGLEILVVRAGRDGAAINDGLDAFAAAALGRNLDVQIVNFPDGIHGFDGHDPGTESKAVISDTFRWIAERITPRSAPPGPPSQR